MFDIGFMELLVVAIVGMVVIGPERLPETARAVGKSVGKVKHFFNAMQRQIDQEIRMDALNKQVMEETKDLEITLNTDLNTGSQSPEPDKTQDQKPAKPEEKPDEPNASS